MVYVFTTNFHRKLLWCHNPDPQQAEKMEQYNTLAKAYAIDFELDDKFDRNLDEILNVLK